MPSLLAAPMGWMWRESRTFNVVALSLIVGGALGNILDRVRHGAVTDFIELHAGAISWPTFNLADSAIVSGVGLLMLATLRRSGPPEATDAAGRRETAHRG